MRGSLREFELPDVLQVVGVSRQHTLIELRDHDGAQRGYIAMKAGQVLRAEGVNCSGRNAFFDLFCHTPEQFAVFRLEDERRYPQPLGRLTNLLFEAVDRASKAAEKVAAKVSKVASQAQAKAQAQRPPVAEGSPPPQPLPKRQTTEPAIRRRASRPTAEQKAAARQSPAAGAPEQVIVGVASPKGGVGKTTITLNLATSLAQRGLRTVVVDADINGDVLSMINAHGRIDRGVFDVLDTPEQVGNVLRSTVLETLHLLPSRGREVPLAALQRPDLTSAWRRVMNRLRPHSDIILVDCPAGMFHVTQPILCSCSHVVGVFQAEMVSSRSFSMFMRGLSMVPRPQRPKLAGVVVNMFRGQSTGSLEAFHQICNDGDRHRLFETAIPRADAFDDASLAGLPLRMADQPGTSAISWLFDSLADEVCQRVGVQRQQQQQRVGSFLV